MSDAFAELGGGPDPAPTRGMRWPAGHAVPEEWIAIGYETRAKAGLARINIRLEAEKFVDFWSAKTGRDAAKLNWLGTWRNWCRNGYGGQPEPEPPKNPAQSQDTDARAIALVLKGMRPQSFGPDLVRRGLAKGLLTPEQARRLGF